MFRRSVIASGLALVLLACGASHDTADNPGATAGASPVGGTSHGGSTLSGGTKSSGGSLSVGGGASPGGSATSGGTTGRGGNNQGGAGRGDGGGMSIAGSPASGGTTNTGNGGTSQAGSSATTGGQSNSGGSNTGGRSSTGGAKTTGGTPATGGSDATGGELSTGGTTAAGGATGTGGATVSTQCSNPLPAGAQPADVSNPTTVVGTGTAASCTFDALNAAVTEGGVIKFDCGSAPVTIAVTATMNLPTNKDTVIDGGGTITLDGEGNVQILRFDHGDWMVNNTRVTLQHLTLINGKATPTEKIPTAPAPCSQGWNDGEGGALYLRDGNLTVIDCTFENNQAAPLGPDTGGGAIYITGSKNGALIVGSTFVGNSASNAGAVGGLFAELDIYNSLFQNNTATGNGANGNEPSECSAINNEQNQVGSGGNGGAIYQDGGESTNVVLCGNQIVNNAAGSGAFGGGVFMTSNDWSGTLTVQDCTITGNTGGSWTQVQEGSVTSLGTAFGVNARSITLRNSTLQGVR